MEASTSSGGILSDGAREERDQVVEMLKKAYWMEIETVMSYIRTRSTPTASGAGDRREPGAGHPGGARARAAVRQAHQGALRRGAGLLEFSAEQSYLQPPEDHTDLIHIVRGVIQAESGAIEYYNEIIEFCAAGVYICYDRHFPDGARCLGSTARRSCSIRRRRWPGLSEYLWKLEQPAHAVANQYFVGAINRPGWEEPWRIGEFYGQSYFVDPRGQFIAAIDEAHRRRHRRRRHGLRHDPRSAQHVAILPRPPAGDLRGDYGACKSILR